MSDYTGEPEHHNRFVYWGAWTLLESFMVIGLFTFGCPREHEANDKRPAYRGPPAAGRSVPSKDRPSATSATTAARRATTR